MIHPSYTELLEVINSGSEEGEAPVVNSRYSIVMAAAKRARQIIAGDQNVTQKQAKKPLSTAVSELYSGKVRILPETEEDQNDSSISAVSSVKGSGAFVEFSEETAEEKSAEDTEDDADWEDEADADFDDEESDDEADDTDSESEDQE